MSCSSQLYKLQLILIIKHQTCFHWDLYRTLRIVFCESEGSNVKKLPDKIFNLRELEILKIDLDIKKELLTPVVEHFLKKQI